MSWITEGKEIAQNIMEGKSTRVKSALFGTDDRIKSFAIGTPENPMGKDVGVEKNAELRKKFEKDLKADNHKFIETKTKGGYVKIKGEYRGNIEHSYFIINPQIDETKALFKWYKQDGFVYAYKDKESDEMIYQFWKMGDDGNYFILSEEKDVQTNVDVDRFFSSLKDFKFNIDFKELSETAEEAHKDLNECVENGNYYKCLDSQVYGDFVHFLNRIMNRKMMYETLKQRKEREKRFNH